MISFNRPCLTGNESQYLLESIKSDKISGDGLFTKKCHIWFENNLECKKVLLTTSCTHALEITAMLINIQPGDEVIMPS
ncbi:MAG: DegT/DnrJ/EryC1/StrS family aminotransferase, partial [Flavobacteriaceae bacterium]|nr:DegT/DnrJ/EryC1/StrS family aminotransferase [Flavobacteriaceae bacterium]